MLWVRMFVEFKRQGGVLSDYPFGGGNCLIESYSQKEFIHTD